MRLALLILSLVSLECSAVIPFRFDPLGALTVGTALPLPSAWYTFDDNAETTVIADTGSDPQDGTAPADTSTITAQGVRGAALTFTQDTFATFGSKLAGLLYADAWTLAFWVKCSGEGHKELLYGVGDDFFVFYNNFDYDVALLYYKSSEVWHSGGFSGTFPDGEWVHLTLSYARPTFKAYRYGLEVSSVNLSEPVATNVCQLIRLGGCGTLYSTTRTLDDVRAYASALSARQVDALFLSYGYPRPAAPEPVLVYTSFGTIGPSDVYAYTADYSMVEFDTSDGVSFYSTSPETIAFMVISGDANGGTVNYSALPNWQGDL